MNNYAIGIDIGGTKIAGTLLSRDGRADSIVTCPTNANGPVDAVIDRVIDLIHSLQAKAAGHVSGIGIGVAAMTDSKRGIVIHASNLKWTNIPLREIILKRLGEDWEHRIWVDKDTNAAILGEMLYGSGRGSQHLLYVAIGTGIGGGMVLGGHLYHGATEGACDVGHLIIEAEGELCGCGKKGCLETIASGPAIARQIKKALLRGAESILSTLEIESITAREVVEAAKKGDALAQSVINDAGQKLGIAIAYYVDINNPELILIGGSVAVAGDLLLEPIRKTVAKRALPANARAARIILAQFGSDAGAIGAAALVWYKLSENYEMSR